MSRGDNIERLSKSHTIHLLHYSALILGHLSYWRLFDATGVGKLLP